MKKFIIFTAVICCFVSCYTPWSDFEFGDELTFSEGEKLHESASAWLRCDSLVYDTDTVSCYFTLHYAAQDTQILLITDSITSKTISYRDEQNIWIELFSVSPFLEPDHRVNIRIWQFEVTVKKPNIYLYPTEPAKINLSLNFLKGGRLIKSIPKYPKKWQDISVKTDGKINSRYDFLFYEVGMRDTWQYSHGWVVKRENLSLFFRLNMEEYGFNKAEIDDFMAYWIPKLNTAEYYAVYPQTSTEIDPVIQIQCDPEPDSVLRLFYVFREMGGFVDLPQPFIRYFLRDGFVLTEWGGICK